MTALDYIRFYWPVGMALVFLFVLQKRLKGQAEFFVFATLMLFGISRLMSADIVPLAVGLLDIPLESVMHPASQIHWIGQMIAATCGLFVVNCLAKRYSGVVREWNRKTKTWETP